MQPSATPDIGSGHGTKPHLVAHRPMGPSVASNEKMASLNSFLRFSPRHKASLTASRKSSGKPTVGRHATCDHAPELCFGKQACAHVE